jgi:hypothetical protein
MAFCFVVILPRIQEAHKTRRIEPYHKNITETTTRTELHLYKHHNNIFITNSASSREFPIVVAGAGPCGLVTALALQRQGVPCVIFQHASRDRLCGNVGGGYDLAPTAFDILKNRLELPIDKAVRSFGGMFIPDMKGRLVRELRLTDMKGMQFYAANRSELQNLLLDAILANRLGQMFIRERKRSYPAMWRPSNWLQAKLKWLRLSLYHSAMMRQ